MTRRLSCTFRPSHASSPTPPPSSTLTFNWLLCVICKMAATLRPCHPTSLLYFSTALILTPQASELMTVNASLMAHGLRMAAPWFDGAAALPTKREGKAAEWWRLKMVVLCCFIDLIHKGFYHCHIYGTQTTIHYYVSLIFYMKMGIYSNFFTVCGAS